jgi:excisionase family DNA binding protein
MEGRFPIVITLEEAAQQLRTTPGTVLAEIEAGRLRGFRIGDEWRTTEKALWAFVGEAPATESSCPTVLQSGHVTESGGAMISEKPSLSSVQWDTVEWEPAPAFSHKWPALNDVEGFEEAYRTEVVVGNRTQPFLIGFTDRAAAGKDDRRRAVVFLGDSPRLLPAVEFAGANDFETSGLMASVIKLPDGKHLRPGAPIPAEYAEMPLDVYNSIVSGPYAAWSIAVAAHKDDHSLMARHALIRARWKGWL